MSHIAFISYAHADGKRLDRLRSHLAMLRRDGSLKAWSDHAIIPGDKLRTTISAALEQSSLFIALVSPDYLASNYCYEKEFQRALALQAEGRLRIVAVILEPCDWLHSPFSEILVLPKDGKPVSEWPNRNTAYLDAVKGIRRALETSTSYTSGAHTLTSNLIGQDRIRQQFDAIQKAEYVERAFSSLRTYFERACADINKNEGQVRARFEPMELEAFTCTVVNRAKKRIGEAHITVRYIRVGSVPSGLISYVYQRGAKDGPLNGWMTVEADKYNLFLRVVTRRWLIVTGQNITSDEVPERLWTSFVTRAGISRG